MDHFFILSSRAEILQKKSFLARASFSFIPFEEIHVYENPFLLKFNIMRHVWKKIEEWWIIRGEMDQKEKINVAIIFNKKLDC